jgi:toxin YoeB
MWKLVFTKQAQLDAKRIDAAGLRANAERQLETLSEDPFAPYPRYEKLLDDLHGADSRRINIQHRLVYQVFREEKTVKVLRMWSHYVGQHS